MTEKEPRGHEASFEGTELEELATRVKRVLDIRDRKYGFPAKTYIKCFVGNEAAKKLVDENIAGDEEDAVRIGNMMLNASVFHHVQDAHPFENKYLFYRFMSDEDHGTAARKPEGSIVSWTDFIAPVAPTETHALMLQPAIPDRDPDLATFTQVDIEACGISPLDEHNARLLDHVHPKDWVDPTPKSIYNLAVIGAGAGGLVSAAAAGVGARVALIESHLLGGDCHRRHGFHSQYSGIEGSAVYHKCHDIQFDGAPFKDWRFRRRPYRARAGTSISALRVTGDGLFTQ